MERTDTHDFTDGELELCAQCIVYDFNEHIIAHLLQEREYLMNLLFKHTLDYRLALQRSVIKNGRTSIQYHLVVWVSYVWRLLT